jgi:hypothetical protein
LPIMIATTIQPRALGTLAELSPDPFWQRHASIRSLQIRLLGIMVHYSTGVGCCVVRGPIQPETSEAVRLCDI